MALCINVCCCSRLAGEGIKALLERAVPDREPTVRACIEPREVFDEEPDLAIVDFNILSHFNPENVEARGIKTLLLGTACIPLLEEPESMRLITRGLIGILPPVAGVEDLKKAVENILEGELWFSRKQMAELLSQKAGTPAVKAPELTRREQEIVRLICRGCRNKDIMAELNISEQSVKSHINHINKKFDVRDRLQLALFALRRWPNYLYDI